MVRLAAVAAVALTLVTPSIARAQATAEGADAIMTALTDWANSITGEKFTLAQIAAEITIQPQDDHYAATLPLGSGPDAPKLTANVTQALGRWVVDEILFPDDAVFNKDNGGPRVELSIEGQSAEIVLDNTFSTATLANAAMTGISLRVQDHDGTGGTLIKVGRALKSSIVRPLFDQHADVAVDALGESFSLRVDHGNAPQVKVDFDHLRTSFAFDGTSRSGTAQLLQTMANKGNAQRAAIAKMPPGSVATALAGFSSGMTIASRFDGLAWDNGEVAGRVRSGQVVFAAAQQDGLVHGALLLDADTLALASAQLGPLADLVPKRFSLRQTFANLPVAALVHLNALNDTNTPPTPDDLQQLFASGGIETDVTEFLLEIGGATFTATGQSLLTAPREATITGTITATGLDALQQRLLASPALAKGAPLLIFLKGVGRTVDDRMIWDIAYRDHQFTVNNQNLSAMLQSFTGAPAPRP